MTLTFKKVIEETKEVDIQFPAYYRNSAMDFYLVKSENEILNIYQDKNSSYFCISSVLKEDVKAKLYSLITKGTAVTAKEFSEAFIKAVKRVTDLLPDNDSLEFLVNSATFKEAV